jgi:hypothetical protein
VHPTTEQQPRYDKDASGRNDTSPLSRAGSVNTTSWYGTVEARAFEHLQMEVADRVQVQPATRRRELTFEREVTKVARHVRRLEMLR